VGETAPLLFTAVGSELINSNPTTQRQDALPLDIWSNVQQASTVTIELAFQAAFVLMSIVLVLFAAARIFGRTKGKKRAKAGEDDLMARFFVPVPIQREEGE
jgi:phosphate transport system permease protein